MPASSQALSEGEDVTSELPAQVSLASRRAWASTALRKLTADRRPCWLHCQEDAFPPAPGCVRQRPRLQVAHFGPHCRCPLSAQYRPGISVWVSLAPLWQGTKPHDQLGTGLRFTCRLPTPLISWPSACSSRASLCWHVLLLEARTNREWSLHQLICAACCPMSCVTM